MPCDLVSNLDLDDILHRHLLWDSLITTVFNVNTNNKKQEQDNPYDLVIIDHESGALVDI